MQVNLDDQMQEKKGKTSNHANVEMNNRLFPLSTFKKKSDEKLEKLC